MLWYQFLDPVESEKINRNYFESMSCSFLYTDTIATEGVHIQNSLILGYRGELLLKNASGSRFDKLLAINKSTTFPWFLNYAKSSVATQETKGTQTCTLYRDFKTNWTEI